MGAGVRRSASTVAQKQRKHNDPYALAQARARKAANQSRQAVLREERAKAMGNPIHGVETPFLKSFDTAVPVDSQFSSPLRPPNTASTSPEGAATPAPQFLKHFVNATGLQDSIAHSQDLSQLPPQDPSFRPLDPDVRQAHEQAHEQEQKNAAEALSRITGIDNAGSADRKRINIQRCVENFGRHNTDKTLRHRTFVSGAIAGGEDGSEEGAKTIYERAGPDTGSSEVQIAILTAKIRTLAQFLETRGRKDKMNKRNLRLLVHRRQKLLRYLRRKERGGERWQHLVQTLGLTEGTWQGEISL